MTNQTHSAAEQLLEDILRLCRSRSPDCFEQESIAAIESFANNELSALRAEVAEVLRPFAEAWRDWCDPTMMGDVDSFCGDGLGNSQWESAAALLAKLDGGE